MTIKETLSHTRQLLVADNILEADLEGELLLRQALGLNRVQLFLALGDEINQKQEGALRQMVKRRLSGEPIAYIIGHRDFYGLDFLVNPSVLIPRLETELLVEKTIALAQSHKAPVVIADIGTGCGAIAISLALSLPNAQVYAIDISTKALMVTQFNCCWHGVESRIRLLHGDMLEPLPKPVDFIVANLPYVEHSHLEPVADQFEPMLALDGDVDGLKEIRRLCSQAGKKLRPGGSLLLEIGEGQKAAVTSLLARLYPSAEIEVTPDFAGIDRVVSMALPHSY